MPYRALGQTQLKVSALGLSANRLGDPALGESAADALISAALDAGVTLIDTFGFRAEERLGRILVGRRHRTMLAASLGDVLGPPLTDDTLELVVDALLVRLRTDWIDLLQLDAGNATVLLDRDLEGALWRLRSAGKVRAFGYAGDGDALFVAASDPRVEVLHCSLACFERRATRHVMRRLAARGAGALVGATGGITERALRSLAGAPGVASVLIETARIAELDACARWMARGPLAERAPGFLPELGRVG